jgi:hypothetical protein
MSADRYDYCIGKISLEHYIHQNTFKLITKCADLLNEGIGVFNLYLHFLFGS